MKQVDILHTIAEWQEYTQDVPQEGFLLFKFSPRCPISRSVERGFDDWCEQLPEGTPLRCVKVDVVDSCELSQHIAKELKVDHKSPQAIWLTQDRNIHWHASHRAISSSVLNAQLEAITA